MRIVRTVLAAATSLSLVQCGSEIPGGGAGGSPTNSPVPADDGAAGAAPPPAVAFPPWPSPAGDPVDPAPAPDPSIDTGADDPWLANPSRASAPFECEGPPISAATLLDYMQTGTSGFLVGTGYLFQGEDALELSEYFRTCTPATGCTDWGLRTGSLASSYAHVALRVTPAGEFYAVSPLWVAHANAGIALRKKLGSVADVQLRVRRLVGWKDDILTYSQEVTDRTRIRATLRPDGRICISAVVRSPPVSGPAAVTEGFKVGMVYVSAAVREVPPPLDESSYRCPGTPSTDAEIAAMFAPGQTYLSLWNKTFARFTRSCHPLTGCTAQRPAGDSSSNPLGTGIVTSAAGGFAVRFDLSSPSYAVKNGIFHVGAGDSGTVRGACMDRRLSIAKVDGYGQSDEVLDLARSDDGP